MGAPPTNDAVLRAAYEAAKRLGSISKAAGEARVNRLTFQARIGRAMKLWGWPHPNAVPVHTAGFTAYQVPPKIRSREEVIKHRLAESDRSADFEFASEITRIDLKTPGPIGLMIFGDPHIDSPGCDFALLKSHLELAAARKEYIFAGNIGDLQDNWIGRLERLYTETTINSKEIWDLVEWMIRDCGVPWAWLIRGNHDCWSGRNDPLDWISKGAGGIGIDAPHGVRIAFGLPSGVEIRANLRHDFPGHSQYNPLHGLKREILHGFRDHIIAAGHRHIGANASDVNGEGVPFVMIRVSGYKKFDSFRHEKGLKSKPLHPAALVVVDPDEPETSPNRVWCAPSVEEGADYLDWKRKRWENTRSRIPKKNTQTRMRRS